MSITKLTTPVKPNDIIKKVNEVIDSDELKAPIATTVTNVSYNSTSKKIQKTINGSTTDVTPVVTSVNGSSGDVTVSADNVFVAIRNTTTFSQITSALNAGKIVFMSLSSSIVLPAAALVGMEMVGTTEKYIFSAIDASVLSIYSVDDSNSWSTSTITLAKNTDLPTITLNGTATTTPSFYAPTTAGTTGYYLKSSGTGAPVWGEAPGGGGSTVGYTPNLTAGAEAGTITIDSVDTKIYVPNVAYATSTTQNTAILTATVSGSQPFALTTGAIVAVKFTYAKWYQTVTTPFTLNVNSTGAKTIYCNGSTVIPYDKTQTWAAGDMVLFVYDGTYWQWANKERVASTSDYGIVQLSTATNSTSTDLAATPSAVKAAYDLANGKSSVTLNGTASATPSFYAPTTAGTAGYILSASGYGAPAWVPLESDIYVVSFEFDDGDIIIDKGYGQIEGAIGRGKFVYGQTYPYGRTYYVCDYDFNEGQYITFASYGVLTEDNQVVADYITIDGMSNVTESFDVITVPFASVIAPSRDGTASAGTSTAYARADHVHPKITQTISMTNNVITLSGSDGTSSTVTLPVYNGGVQTV